MFSGGGFMSEGNRGGRERGGRMGAETITKLDEFSTRALFHHHALA